jgi:tryptophan synthase alpha chain
VEPLARALSSVRAAGRPSVVPYLMVDRARRARLAPTAAALARAGASALELGFPFSDPIADGPTLEAAADRALAHGTRWTHLLEQLRATSRLLPTAVMTYANPVWARGLARAARQLRDAGATGLIVPDLSLEEAGPWKAAASRAGLSLVLLAAPSASPDRVATIARSSSGFLYLVSRFGTTGGPRGPSAARDLAPLVAAAHAGAPGLPVLIGFGVRDPPSARASLASGADGVVVGSALEQEVARGRSPAELGRWLSRLVRAAESRPRSSSRPERA